MERYQVVTALAALAQDSRLGIFRLLVHSGSGGLPAGRIAELLGIPSATLSFHLSQLRQAGLVKSRRQGRSRIYAAELATMNDLVGYLLENCCEGDAVVAGAGGCTPAAGEVPPPVAANPNHCTSGSWT